jgi:dihydrodipicolinate synthase/N-acetylneuraminate lyase
MDVHCRYGMVSDALMWNVGKPPAGIKGAMKMLGLPGGEPREHIKPLTQAEQKLLRRILIEAGCLEGPVAKRA